MKTLRLLQYFPAPADASVLGNLNDLLRKIIRGDTVARQSHKDACCLAVPLCIPRCNMPL